MHLNADFSKPVVLNTVEMPWQASPMAGVFRRKLDRIGEEVARATSLVKYDAGSYFTEHTHDGGEEFLVLEGVFSDQYGDYPAGTYVRNPIGSKHRPHSQDGCTIFVKLHQFHQADTAQFAVDTRNAIFQPSEISGIDILPLHEFKNEMCCLLRYLPGTEHKLQNYCGGEEILILEGSLSDQHGDYSKGTWLRSPAASDQRRYSHNGCLIYRKTGHLLSESGIKIDR